MRRVVFRIHQRSDSRQEERGPLCATYPNHRGNKGSYPRSIQSFIRLSPERGEVSARRGIPPITPLRTLPRRRGSHPWVSPKLSPGVSYRPPYAEYTMVAAGTGGGCTPGYTRKEGGWYIAGIPLYPPWYPGVHSRDTSLPALVPG